MPKMFLVLMILLLTNNICNAAIYKNIENDFLIDIGDNWNLSDKSTQEGGMVLIFTASDDKKKHCKGRRFSSYRRKGKRNFEKYA